MPCAEYLIEKPDTAKTITDFGFPSPVVFEGIKSILKVKTGLRHLQTWSRASYIVREAMRPQRHKNYIGHRKNYVLCRKNYA